ncbi:hypothetical protein K439DRAFT_1346748, partial [Ramaria rubella]
LLKAYKKALVDADLEHQELPWDVSTRWNSMAELLSVTIKVYKAINDITDKCANKVTKLWLSKKEWQIARDLLPGLLEITKHISRSNVPMLHKVILLIDNISHALNSLITNVDLHLSICHAAFRGRTVLNKYYSKTDQSELYRLSLCK